MSDAAYLKAKIADLTSHIRRLEEDLKMERDARMVLLNERFITPPPRTLKRDVSGNYIEGPDY